MFEHWNVFNHQQHVLWCSRTSKSRASCSAAVITNSYGMGASSRVLFNRHVALAALRAANATWRSSLYINKTNGNLVRLCGPQQYITYTKYKIYEMYKSVFIYEAEH